MYTSILALILALIAGLNPFTTEDVAQAPAPVVQEVELSWEDSVLYEAGLTLPANTTLHFTDLNNCGSALSPTGTGGGCMRTGLDGAKYVLVSPHVYGTLEGKHILLHEVAHAQGIMDECTAEYFAHDHGSEWYMWSYPQCQTVDEAPVPTYTAPVAPVQQEQPVAQTVAPVAPETAPIAPVTAPVTAPETPVVTEDEGNTNTCTNGTVAAEDGSCVDPSFWDDMPTPTTPTTPATFEACSEFELRAEDGTCVPNNYWDSAPEK